jgi:GNAT superfamily N-acetyltransferase
LQQERVICAPRTLWSPDQGSELAWLGKLHELVVADRCVRLHPGVLPRRFAGRGCHKHAAAWVRRLPKPITPDELLALTDLASQQFSSTLRTEFRRHSFNITVVVYDKHTMEAVALAKRRFLLNDGTVEHRWLRVAKQSQGHTIATRLIAAWLPLYRQWDIYRVRMNAGLSAGGAVWPKFGFVPEEEDWYKLQRKLYKRLNRLASSQPSPDVVEKLPVIEGFVKSPDPKSVWLISDVVTQHNGQGLGHFLLQGTRWRGTLDFADKHAVDRLKARLRKNQIGFGALDELAAAATAAKTSERSR